ncbi:MAG: NfeD family protein [Sulfurospirillaceae bacterium]|nr:NfeD family protein [Sulfurospirillaceae bacterium]
MGWYIWATLGVLAIVFEVASPSFFAGFVGIGFLGSAIASYLLEDSLTLQIIIALVGMFVGVFVFKRQKLGEIPASRIGQSDEFIGVKGKVVKQLSEDEMGSVKLHTAVLGNSQWPAVSQNDENLEVGTIIEIVAIAGSHLIVKKL